MRDDVSARRLRDLRQPGLVMQRRDNCARQTSGLRIVVNRVLAADQGTIALDGRGVDHRYRPAGGRLIMAKTIPAETLRRPDQPSAGAALIILLGRQRPVGNVYLRSIAVQRPQFGQTATANARGVIDTAAEEDVSDLVLGSLGQQGLLLHRQPEREGLQLCYAAPVSLQPSKARRREIRVPGLEEYAPPIDRQLAFKISSAAIEQKEVVAIDHRRVLVVENGDRSGNRHSQKLRAEPRGQRQVTGKGPAM